MKTTYSLTIILCLFLFASCKKDKQTSTPAPPSATVYVLGSTDNSSNIYWKNGTANNLTANFSISASAGAFFVSGNDIYAAGGSNLNIDITNGSAGYLKNGVATTLPDSTGRSFANCLFVSGSDVYVAGIMHYPTNSTVPYTTPTANYPKNGDVATLWKDGVAATLPSTGFLGQDNGFTSSLYVDYISGIFVSGNDVYVAGGSHLSQLSTPSTYHFARYWKNGVSTDLVNGLVSADGSVTAYPTTTAIYVSGSDVYVAGFEGGNTQQALYWKNGTATLLTTPGVPSIANAIFVSGSDVYVAGYEITNGTTEYATYWKNGVAVNLTNGTTSSNAQSIYVSGNDVYVAGSENINGVNYATYWKNGTTVKLGSNATASSIYVK